MGERKVREKNCSGEDSCREGEDVSLRDGRALSFVDRSIIAG